jgi:hypothetical protein
MATAAPEASPAQTVAIMSYRSIVHPGSARLTRNSQPITRAWPTIAPVRACSPVPHGRLAPTHGRSAGRHMPATKFGKEPSTDVGSYVPADVGSEAGEVSRMMQMPAMKIVTSQKRPGLYLGCDHS